MNNSERGGGGGGGQCVTCTSQPRYGGDYTQVVG